MTILNLEITQSEDDGTEAGTGVISLNAASNNIGNANAWFCFIFQNVTIPKGAIIVSAVLQIYLTSTAADSPAYNVYFQAADTVASLTTDVDNISSRPRTTAFVNWVGTDLGVGYTSSPDLSVPLTEVINRAGWASGNALAVIFDCQTGVSSSVRMWDAGLDQHALLDIEYFVPKLIGGKVIQSPRPIHQLRI